MNTKHLSKGKIALITAIIAIVCVAASLYIPIHWQNNPPKCCDIPNSGTHYGFPFPIKSEACCGITARTLYTSNYPAAAYDFLIDFAVLLIIAFIIRKIIRSHYGN